MDSENSLISHLEALRGMLLMMLAATALLYPVGYLACPYVIGALVHWCCPPSVGALHYFAPMEVFFVKLKLALVLALVLAYPWNVYQLWRFLLPALYEGERRALKYWLLSSSLLFAMGVAFCITFILPLLMRFSAGFATVEVQPILGLSGFISLSGWLMLAFGLMFQVPILVLVAVRFGLVSYESLRKKRPYVMVVILTLAALLTPPDVVSQLMLAIPTWLLFEIGLLVSKRVEKQQNGQT